MAERKPGFEEQFCPSCGAIVNERAPYCPDCGHPISPENRPSEAGGGENINIGYETIDEKRQRQKKTAKEIGSSVMDESDSLAPMVKSASLWVVGLFLLLGGVGSLSSPELSPVVGIPLAAIGLILLPPVHGLVGRDAGPFAFGSRKVVEENSVINATEPCAACAGKIDEGVERKRLKQFLLFGGAVSSNEQGRRVYCRACALGEVVHTRGDETTVFDDTRNRSNQEANVPSGSSAPNESKQTTTVSDSDRGQTTEVDDSSIDTDKSGKE